MRETIFLHIRSRDASPTRVLEVDGASVRIGRGEQCEVKLGGAALADVQCMLRKRGAAWHVQPVGPPGRISIEGRAVEQTRPLPLDTEFRVGDHWLSLRPAEAPVVANWGRAVPPAPEPRREPERVPLVAEPVAVEPTPRRVGASPWQDRIEDRERRLDASLQERRWAARWKAAGAGLKARSATVAPPEPPRAPAAAPAAPRTKLPSAASVVAPRARVAPAARPEPVAPVMPEVVETPRVVTSAPAAVVVEPVAKAHEWPGFDGPSAGIAEALRGTRHLETIEACEVEAAVVEPVREPQVGGALALIEAPKSAAGVAVEDVTPRPAPARRRARRASLGVASEGAPTEEPVAPMIADLPTLDFAALLKMMIEGPLVSGSPAEGLPIYATTAPDASLAPPAVAMPMADEEIIVAFEEPEAVLAPAEVVAFEEPEAVLASAEDAVPAEAAAEEEAPERIEVTAGGDMLDWPSARTMFGPRRRVHAAQAPSGPSKVRATSRRAAAARREAFGPTPTTGRAPGQWSVSAPGWLWGPTVVAAAAIGVAGVGLSWAWAKDDQAAGQAANRLLAPGAGPDAEEAGTLLAEMGPDGPWWKTTAGHLLFKAALADRAGADSREQVPGLLRSARGAAPAHAATRLASARSAGVGGAPAPLAESLGLSHDVVALAWTGRRLAEAGKVEPALKRYREALELVAATPASGQAPPRVIALGTARRLALPGEDQVEPIVREMAGHAGWTYARWSAALPAHGVAPLVAARVLRETGHPEAEAALDAALAAADASPVGLAARAEALALKERFEEAEAEYHRAIAATADDDARRAWSLNLAEVCSRLNDDARRQAAWEAAKGGGPGDEITRLVVEARARAGADAPLATIARRP